MARWWNTRKVQKFVLVPKTQLNNHVFLIREWISPAAATYIINELTVNRNEQPDYMKTVDFYIVPVLNPDGYEYTHSKPSRRLWRKNLSNRKNAHCKGVDLNRNFNFQWGGKGSSGDQCQEDYRGVKGFSEPESRAVENFFEKSQANFLGFLSLHSYGQYILVPWAYDYVKTKDYKDLMKIGNRAAKVSLKFRLISISKFFNLKQKIRKLTSKQYKVGSTPDILYTASGGSNDWAKGVHNIKYSFVMELRNKKSFILPASQIIPAGKEAFALVKEVALAITE